MIENTFLHLPGVGPVFERKLWKAGYSDWDCLWQALTSGVSARDCVRDRYQGRLFEEPDDVVREDQDARTLAWIDHLDQSRIAIAAGDYGFFLRKLPPASHWRLLPEVIDDALFLDIETTGLSREHHYITVIGALHQSRFHQWTWPQSPKLLVDLIQQASAIITFNGARFDLPFIRRQIPLLSCAKPHIDLLYIARAAGVRGGQKDVERELGLSRTKSIEEYDGEAAVYSWCSSLYGDGQEYNRLLKYNRADVEALPNIAVLLYGTLQRQTHAPAETQLASLKRTRAGHLAGTHDALRIEWQRRMPSYHQIQKSFRQDVNTPPLVVGIDLRAKETRPTGWAACYGTRVETAVLFSDHEILERTVALKPDLVSIDAPLSLPRGRHDVSDESPCRKDGGIVRDAERILWSRHIRVYPALIRQMQGLTARGIALASRLESHRIRVIESYPGAAQDVLNIPRKKDDKALLEEGLRQFGYDFAQGLTHDELDAITSALVGHFYLAGQFEAIGADDEGYMINPRLHDMRWDEYQPLRTQVVFLAGLPGAGKTTVAKLLSRRLGWNCLILGDELRRRAESNSNLDRSLNRGDLAPEWLVLDIISKTLVCDKSQQVVIDGFPRHQKQVDFLSTLDVHWRVVWLDLPVALATERAISRQTCQACGHMTRRAEVNSCPVCGALSWRVRGDDSPETVAERMYGSSESLSVMLKNMPLERLDRIDADKPIAAVCADIVRVIDTLDY